MSYIEYLKPLELEFTLKYNDKIYSYTEVKDNIDKLPRKAFSESNLTVASSKDEIRVLIVQNLMEEMILGGDAFSLSNYRDGLCIRSLSQVFTFNPYDCLLDKDYDFLGSYGDPTKEFLNEIKLDYIKIESNSSNLNKIDYYKLLLNYKDLYKYIENKLSEVDIDVSK